MTPYAGTSCFCTLMNNAVFPANPALFFPALTGFTFRLTLYITGSDDRFDIASNIEIAFQMKLERIACRHKIFADLIDYVLVKNLDVAE